MSYQNTLSQHLSAENIDLTLAKIGVFVCLSLLSLRLLAEQVLLVVIPVAAGTACGLYILAHRQQAQQFGSPILPYWISGYLPSMVVFGLAAFVILVQVNGGRSISTHLLVGGIGALILVQLFLVEDGRFSTTLVLGQILVASVVIRLGTLFGTSGFIGVDIWTHVPVFIGGIVDSGSLVPIADTKYIMAPIYHINGAVGALVFGTPRLGTYLTLGVLLGLSALLIYVIAGFFLPTRWALLATALFVFSDQFIRWGIHVIPTSLGLVFFLGALFCLTGLYYWEDDRLIALLLTFSLAIVFTHQVSTTIVLFLLAVAVVGTVGIQFTRFRSAAGATPRTRRGIVAVFVTTLTVTLVSWSNTPFSDDFIFLWRMLDVLEATLLDQAGFLNLAGGGGAGGATGVENTGLLASVLPFLEWFGFAILFAVSVLGGLFWLNRSEPADVTVTYLASAATMFVVVFGLSLFGVRTLMPGRWLVFLYALLVVLGAVGLYHVSRYASPNVILAILVIVALGFPMTMAVTEKATLDSPAFEDEYPRFSYTDSEIGAVHTISEIHPPTINEEIETDHPYRTLFARLGDYEKSDLELDEGGTVSSNPVVARNYQQQGPVTVYEAGDPAIPRQSRVFLDGSVCSPTRNHVYTNGDVTLCTVPSEPAEVSS